MPSAKSEEGPSPLNQAQFRYRPELPSTSLTALHSAIQRSLTALMPCSWNVDEGEDHQMQSGPGRLFEIIMHTSCTVLSSLMLQMDHSKLQDTPPSH